MKLIYSLFLLIFSWNIAAANMLSGQSKDIIHMDTSFNGTDITVFGTLPNKKIKSVDIEFLGPTRHFTAFNTENYEEETISAPSFYAGHNAKTIPHFEKLKRYLENNHLLQTAPKVTLRDNALFSSKLFLPAEAPTGYYTIQYYIQDHSGKEYIKSDMLFVKPVGLQHILYRLATEYPFLNAILVIISATFMSHIIRFVMRKN